MPITDTSTLLLIEWFISCTFSRHGKIQVNLLCPFGLTKTLDFILRFLAMAMTEQAHHCSSVLTKTFTCVQLSNTYLSATLTTTTFPTAAACRGFDASACTPTPRDLLSSHWQLLLHLIWKVANPLYIDVRLVAHGQSPVLPSMSPHSLSDFAFISARLRINSSLFINHILLLQEFCCQS